MTDCELRHPASAFCSSASQPDQAFGPLPQLPCLALVESRRRRRWSGDFNRVYSFTTAKSTCLPHNLPCLVFVLRNMFFVRHRPFHYKILNDIKDHSASSRNRDGGNRITSNHDNDHGDAHANLSRLIRKSAGNLYSLALLLSKFIISQRVWANGNIPPRLHAGIRPTSRVQKNYECQDRQVFLLPPCDEHVSRGLSLVNRTSWFRPLDSRPVKRRLEAKHTTLTRRTYS